MLRKVVVTQFCVSASKVKLKLQGVAFYFNLRKMPSIVLNGQVRFQILLFRRENDDFLFVVEIHFSSKSENVGTKYGLDVHERIDKVLVGHYDENDILETHLADGKRVGNAEPH